MAAVVPDSSTPTARPRRSGATSSAAAVTASARNPALANAATTREAHSRGNEPVVAPATWAAANRRRNASRPDRRGHRRASAAIGGAPATMPTANAEVSRPAVPTGTSRSAARSGSRPDSMNSEVPMANTARASRYRARGIARNSGVRSGNGQPSRHQEGTHRHRTARDGAVRQRRADSGVQGPTAGPKTPTSSDSGLTTLRTLPDSARPVARISATARQISLCSDIAATR